MFHTHTLYNCYEDTKRLLDKFTPNFSHYLLSLMPMESGVKSNYCYIFTAKQRCTTLPNNGSSWGLENLRNNQNKIIKWLHTACLV